MVGVSDMEDCIGCNVHFRKKTLDKYGGYCARCYKQTRNYTTDTTGTSSHMGECIYCNRLFTIVTLNKYSGLCGRCYRNHSMRLISLYTYLLLNNSNSYEQLNDLCDQIGNVVTRVSSQRISKIPTYTYVLNDKIITCNICLECFNDGDTIMKLDCDHEFHNSCIIQWLKMSKKCPICRHLIDE